MYIITKGSDKPFESFGIKLFASTTSTFNSISGGFFCAALSSNSSCRSFVTCHFEIYSQKSEVIQMICNFQLRL